MSLVGEKVLDDVSTGGEKVLHGICMVLDNVSVDGDMSLHGSCMLGDMVLDDAPMDGGMMLHGACSSAETIPASTGGGMHGKVEDIEGMVPGGNMALLERMLPWHCRVLRNIRDWTGVGNSFCIDCTDADCLSPQDKLLEVDALMTTTNTLKDANDVVAVVVLLPGNVDAIFRIVCSLTSSKFLCVTSSPPLEFSASAVELGISGLDDFFFTRNAFGILKQLRHEFYQLLYDQLRSYLKTFK